MDISAWLRELGLERYEQTFRENAIGSDVLAQLTDEHLKDLGLPLGDRLRLLNAIARLAARTEPPVEAEPSASTDAAATAAPGGAERRQLTVMFCDLVGSTALSAALDPEDMREVIRAYQNTVAGEIRHFEGYVAKFMGDGVLAYFGWPRAHEDEAERAVRAGLAITDAVHGLSAPAGEPLAARVGIATGVVVVGDLVGESASEEQAVVGDTPNLAARLQTFAQPGQVVIADATRQLLGVGFTLVALGPQALKGIAEPVKASAVLGTRVLESRFESRSGPYVPPMVGRSQELALLLERWAQAKAGEGQSVLLIGEAGIGKSRIVRALLDAIADQPHTRIHYQCSPYHTQSALWPVIQQLTYAAGIEADDTADAKLDKLEALLARAGDPGTAAPLLADLIGLDDTKRYGGLDLSAQARRTRTMATLTDQLLGLAARQPVLVVLEDAHWIDPTTLEMMGHALDRIAEARVLILLTTRPEEQPALAGHAHVTRLTLNRLGRAGTEAIVERLRGDSDVPVETIGAIIERTDGVPLYVEELTKAVLETGRTTIPASLHDSLMARLDRIPEVKEVAQAGAVIGREFRHDLLATVASIPEAALNAALDRLIAAELIFRRGPSPAGYIFKHALVQEAAYQSLLKAKRRELHARVVEALEARSSGAVPKGPELLAYHSAQAGLIAKAVEYHYQAGQEAAARGASAEAAEQLSRGIELLASPPDSPEGHRRELDLQTALGAALISAKGYAADETGRAFGRARALCEQAGDVHRLMPVLNGQLLFLNERAEQQAAYEIAGEMLDVAERRADSSLLIPAHRAMSLTTLYLGRFVASREHAERVLALFDPAQHRSLVSRYAFDQRTVALGYLASALFALGYPDQALHQSATAIEEARSLAHPPSLAQALHFMCRLQCMSRDVAGLQDAADMMIAIAMERDLPNFGAWGKVWRGVVWLEAGKTGDGFVEVRERRASIGRLRNNLVLAENFVAPARRQPISELVMAQLGEGPSTLWCAAEWHRMAGERLLSSAEPDQEEIEAHFRRALEVARAQEAKMWELRAATSLARLWAGQGERQKARDLLAPVYGWFTEGFDTADLKDAKTLLDELR